MRELTVQNSLDEAKALSQNDDAPKLRNAGRSLCDAFRLFLAELGRETYDPEFISNQPIKNRFRFLLQSLPELRKYRRLAHELDRLRNTTEHSDLFSPEKAKLENLITQAESLFTMMQSLKAKLKSQRAMGGQRSQKSLFGLYSSFSQRLDFLVTSLESNASSSEDLEPQLEQLVESFKQGVDESDLQWIEMATRELFKKLYKFSERSTSVELYAVFKKLFAYARARGEGALGPMIHAFDMIMQECWAPGYDVEKAEKAAKVMLKLGIDFLGKDSSVTRQCATAIDNLASDMFEPEVLAKEIVLAACAFEADPNNPELQELSLELAYQLEINDQYAWEDGIITYLRDSIDFARAEQEQYGVDIRRFEDEFLSPALQSNIDANITAYVASLKDIDEEGREYLKLARDELVAMISDYRRLRPGIADEIKRRVLETKDQKMLSTFDRIVNRSKILRESYGAPPRTKSED